VKYFNRKKISLSSVPFAFVVQQQRRRLVFSVVDIYFIFMNIFLDFMNQAGLWHSHTHIHTYYGLSTATDLFEMQLHSFPSHCVESSHRMKASHKNKAKQKLPHSKCDNGNISGSGKSENTKLSQPPPSHNGYNLMMVVVVREREREAA